MLLAKNSFYGRNSTIDLQTDLQTNLPWPETLEICEYPLELEDVHDDLGREVKRNN